MTRYLITQSLLASWNYVFSCYETNQDSAYNDFLDALGRKKRATTPAMQNGIDFENEVYKEAKGAKRSPHPKWEKGIKAVADIIKDAPTQIKVQRELQVSGYTLLVYGILDSLKAGTVYDVKFCNKSFHTAELAGKYLDSPQHPAYLYAVPEAQKFTYLVSDGTDLYTESYTKNNTKPFEDIAKSFIFFLETSGLMPLYKEKWKSLN